MGLFTKKKPQPKTKEIEVAIRKVKDGDGEKYMHIGDFISLLEQYQAGADMIDTKLIQQLITELNKA